MLSFGVTVLPDPPYQRMIELMKLAEQHGFEYAWTYDSHILWEESYVTLPLAAAQTSKIKLGHFVTNPGIRDATITASWYATMQDISDGRMVMGIGRGDSSRRVVGLKPVRVADFEQRCAMIKELMNGRTVDWNEKELELEAGARGASRHSDVDRGLRAEGARRRRPGRRRRDHPAGDPVIIQWIMDTARRAAEEGDGVPASSSASSAHRVISPTTSRTRASSRAGSRRWCRTTSWI